ncbi:hypothetical protein JCM5350_005850 [Sporobolomyces pararoseus]
MIDRTISEEGDVWREQGERGGGEVDEEKVSSSTPEEQLEVWKTKQVEPGLKGEFFVVKVENVPFSVRYRDIENWLPLNVLPRFEECPQPIHIILHRASGRTLPHCYIELKDYESALKVIKELDRTVLVTRTVRIKAERVGELMRDLFDQSKYFCRSNDPERNFALDPLPFFPQDGYQLPPQLLDENDLHAIESWLAIAPWSHFASRPVERGYTHLGSILSKFPFEARPDLWNDNLRDYLFYLTCRAVSLARETKGYLQHDFAPIADRLVELVSKCQGFTQEQRDHYTTFTLKDFPPLSSSSSPSSKTSPQTTFKRSESTRTDQPPASSWDYLESTVTESREYKSTVDGYDPSPETAPPDWLRRKRSSSFERSNAPTPSRQTREPRVLYWADEPLSAANLEREQAPPISSTSVSHSTSVSIPPSSWFESSSSKSPVTPIDKYSHPSVPTDLTQQYPLTPPESPEAIRPRYSKEGGSGRALDNKFESQDLDLLCCRRELDGFDVDEEEVERVGRREDD